ncbi:MAG TPA: CDP-diacylglycerol--serine O-phosphatidyltransferase [Gemmatimonadaceae bacterium]|nr:CDP-diacylglycerol--serine O-phosphatidyltransferase [Gemmatimonadaceae bacterium]
MSATRGLRDRRRTVRRAVVMMPNGLTLINLFCGIYAIILAIRGDFGGAPALIVLGGIADTLDGRVARATGTGSKFGEELDSLVDAISFGFAPALIMYLEIPNHGTWEWLLVFIFTSCAVMRLARFNVEQAGRKKTHFHGLPSPAAGLTLATYYWFSQTPLYNQTVILFTDSKTLSDLPWHTILRGLMAVLAALMISDVPYPTVPSIGLGSIRKIIGSLVVAGCIVLLVVGHTEFIFPALLAYVLYGAIKWVILGFLGRSSTPDEIFLDGRHSASEWDGGIRRTPSGSHAGRGTPIKTAAVPGATLGGDDARGVDRRPPDEAAARRRRRRRGGRGNRPHGSPPPGPPLPESPSGPSE